MPLQSRGPWRRNRQWDIERGRRADLRRWGVRIHQFSFRGRRDGVATEQDRASRRFLPWCGARWQLGVVAPLQRDAVVPTWPLPRFQSLDVRRFERLKGLGIGLPRELIETETNSATRQHAPTSAAVRRCEAHKLWCNWVGQTCGQTRARAHTKTSKHTHTHTHTHTLTSRSFRLEPFTENSSAP